MVNVALAFNGEYSFNGGTSRNYSLRSFISHGFNLAASIFHTHIRAEAWLLIVKFSSAHNNKAVAK